MKKLINTKTTNPNYLAEFIKLPDLQPHPNADRLKVVNINFNSVIVGPNAVEGQTYIYFPLESRINEEFLSFTNSFASAEKNVDKNVKGYFDNNGRVRAVRLRGQKSEGYVLPITLLVDWLKTKNIDFVDDGLQGITFDSIGDILLCEKYVVKNTRQQGSGKQGKTKKKKESKIIPDVFKFHVDTVQLKRNMFEISPDDIISISYKQHGTSCVLALLPCRKKLKWKDKIAKFLGVNVQETKPDYIFSSRRVIKNDFDSEDKNHYYSTDIWTETGNRYKESIQEGISIYGEIVGYLSNGAWIQKDYDYGMQEGKNELFVYRITFTDSKGNSYEFTRPQIEEYCKKYQLKTTPLFFYGKAKDLYPDISINEHWHENYLNRLIQDYNEKDCYICKNKVPEEGIVVVKENLFSFDAYKLKSFRFLEKETKELDKGIVSIEDSDANQPYTVE